MTYEISYYPSVGTMKTLNRDNLREALELAESLFEKVKVPVVVKELENGYPVHLVKKFS